MEIVVTLAIVAVLATLVIQFDSPESPNDRARYADISDALWKISQAIAGNQSLPTAGTLREKSFRQVIGVYPSRLEDLSNPIATTGKNICNAAYTTAQTLLWLDAFYPREFLSAGTPLGDGFNTQDVLVPVSVGAGVAGTLAIRMPGTELRDAQGLDLTVDGVADGTSGIVRYSSTDPTSVDYYVTITGC